MAKSQELADFEQIVEKIIFNDDELGKLKIAIKNFTEGKTSAKELKHLLLQCRGRMMEDITDFTFLFAEKRTQNLLQTEIKKKSPISTTKGEFQLRKEIEEKNELLETIAKRVDKLVSKLNTERSNEDQKQFLIDDTEREIERCLTKIGAKEWIKMCYFDDYKFFDKLYPKLETLYKEQFGESEEIMANKMVRLGFPKDIETIVIKYIIIRNKFQHSMEDISQSSLELAREVFTKVFVYLMLSSIESKFLLKNREMLYANLTEFFSNRLTGNSVFRKILLERFKTVFEV